MFYFCTPFYGRVHYMVLVAQLVRALDCGSRGRGFKSHQAPNNPGFVDLSMDSGIFFAFRIP